MDKIDLDSIIKNVNDLPSLPHLVVKIMEMTDDPKVTARDIKELLSRDQGLAAKILRMANSTYYGFSRHISTLTEATICLGLKTVRSIAIAASVNNMLNKELKGYGIDKGQLWEHSQYTAMLAKHLAGKIKVDTIDIEVAFTAALLHDIGKIVLDNTMKELYPQVLELVTQKNISFTEAETQIMGFNHATAGARIAERWNLPYELVESIANHHSPELAGEYSKITYLIYLANAISLAMQKSSSLEINDLLPHRKALEALGLDFIEVLDYVSEVKALKGLNSK